MSRDSIVDGDWLPATDSLCRTIVILSYVRREKFGGGVLHCTECTAQTKEFELILTIKMETRHSVGKSFGGL